MVLIIMTSYLSFQNGVLYSGAFSLSPGFRVLIVDQWIETGGTMKAAINLVEKQGATVAGELAVK